MNLPASIQPGPRDDAEAWLFARLDTVPERWRDRAITVVMVPLLPGESARLLRDEPAARDLDFEDHGFLRLVARGLSASAIAGELGAPLRTIQRRLARLRERVNVETTAELVAILSRRGF